MLFDDAKRILHEKRELLLSSERSMRIVLIFLDSEAEDPLTTRRFQEALACIRGRMVKFLKSLDFKV